MTLALLLWTLSGCSSKRAADTGDTDAATWRAEVRTASTSEAP